MLNQKKRCILSFQVKNKKNKKKHATSHLRVKNVGHLWKGEHVALASTRAQQGSKTATQSTHHIDLSVKHPPLQVRQQRHKHTGYTRKPHNERKRRGSERSVPFSHVDPQFATPRELFPSHPNPVYPHLHQLLPQRTPPEYHCAKPSGTTRVKTTIKAKIKNKK